MAAARRAARRWRNGRETVGKRSGNGRETDRSCRLCLTYCRRMYLSGAPRRAGETKQVLAKCWRGLERGGGRREGGDGGRWKGGSGGTRKGR